MFNLLRRILFVRCRYIMSCWGWYFASPDSRAGHKYDVIVICRLCFTKLQAALSTDSLFFYEFAGAGVTLA